MNDLPVHPKTGAAVLSEVFADPGRNDFYYRSKRFDSVMRYVPAAPLEAEIDRLRGLLSANGIDPGSEYICRCGIRREPKREKPNF